MSDGTEKKSFLSSIFNAKTLGKVALYAASTAFGFVVLGALDFTLFHELAEGAIFMEAAGPLATDLLRSEFMGVSVAGLFVDAADYIYSINPATVDPVVEATAAAAQQNMGGGFFQQP